MEAFPHGILLAWSFPLLPAVGLSLTLAIYLRGWRALQQTRAQELPVWRAICFTGGLTSLWIALASPIDALDDFVLSAHMLQHFILMSIAPPLLLLGAPLVPLLRGSPRAVIRLLRPVFMSRVVRRVIDVATSPVFAWTAMNLAYLGWHVPGAFEVALRSERWHTVEHLSFFVTSIAFWLVVLEPWPSRTRWSRWMVIPYLLTADLVNTVLSAILAFSGRVIYPSYGAAERLFRYTPLQDQVLAGAEMWVLNSIVFVAPVVAIIVRLLTPPQLQGSESRLNTTSAGSQPSW